LDRDRSLWTRWKSNRYPWTITPLAVSMKEEVLEYFSGMIYGYSFRYVPWDIARGIDEELEVELLGRINPTGSWPQGYGILGRLGRLQPFLRAFPLLSQ
jgi:hypothetical protein